ncbi:hypothetical protein UFOVP92_4 [uncultured Caudovirales phage]|uniref:Uncharacterized protein n=1 Tax=uncultured Caudovirales phage TaxID=2100421 RepID=A0A6J5L4L4_9CAUD|nr:hypothetical protein UFOVP92_4 [uncultured Caudovirales phage]
MKKETGGPAFPCKDILVRGDLGECIRVEVATVGLFMRDYFAAKALPMTLDHNTSFRVSSEVAYQIADAMLEARK